MGRESEGEGWVRMEEEKGGGKRGEWKGEGTLFS